MEKCELPPNHESQSRLLEGYREAWLTLPVFKLHLLLWLRQLCNEKSAEVAREIPSGGRKFPIRSKRENNPCLSSVSGSSVLRLADGPVLRSKLDQLERRDPELALSDSHGHCAVGGMTHPQTGAPRIEHGRHSGPTWHRQEHRNPPLSAPSVSPNVKPKCFRLTLGL